MTILITFIKEFLKSQKNDFDFEEFLIIKRQTFENMGVKLSKIPFDLEYNDNICSNCNGNIEFKKRTDHIGINWKECCGGCISCLRGKGCGGYEKIEEKEVDIPICNNCNICPMCKESVFNINERYQEHTLCKKDGSYFHVDCYRKYTEPKDPKRHYEWNGFMNSRWEFKGIYHKCNECSKKYVITIDDKPVTKDEARKKIVDIYQKCNPQEIGKVDDLLNEYVALGWREHEAIALVNNKYAAKLIARKYITDIFERHCPQKLRKIDDKLVEYAGHEARYVADLQKKYDGGESWEYGDQTAMKYPNTCPECISNKEFQIEWKTLTPVQKLSKCGLEKLKILAKKKKIKGCSKWNKAKFLKELEPLVTHKDFPIK